MVASIVIVVITCAISCLLLYKYVASMRRISQFNEKINALENDLKELRDQDKDLQSQLVAKEDQLRQTFQDSVTGLLGWQVFNDRIHQSIKHAERHRLSLAILMIDIDDFSILNEAFGDDTGNTILHEVGQRITVCLRQVDSACRISKDTFAVLLAQVSKPEAAVIVAQRILQSISAPVTVKNHQLHLTGCIGLSLCPEDSNDPAILLRNADHALKAAKEKGRQTYQFYQDNMQARSQRELLLCTGLSSETLFDELTVQYQPIIDVSDQSIVCMEAVPGWQHPTLGLIAASELFHYADRQRKLSIVTEWLLRHACEKFQQWQAVGFMPNLLSIPLTMTQLQNSNFVYRLSLIMQESEFKTENLLIEIKDSNGLASFDILEKSFNMLKYLDVKIGIGDFGFSAMTLRYLRNMKIHYIKLENILIDDINVNEREKALVSSVIKFAKDLSIKTVAQGVETEEQVKLLAEMGCTLMQGKFLGGLLAGDDVPDKMKNRSEVE